MMKYPIEFDPTALSLLGPLIKESVIAVGRKKKKENTDSVSSERMHVKPHILSQRKMSASLVV